jgi:hypothetical protein
MTKSILISFLLLLAIQVDAQTDIISKENANAVVHKINEQILNAKFYSANLTFSIFNSYFDTIPVQTSYGFYKRSGDKLHSLLVGIETIQNNNERLEVDTAMENIIMGPPSHKPQLIESSLESALAMCKKITKTKTQIGYLLTFYLDPAASLGFSTLQIEYDDQHFFITSLTMHYLNSTIPGFESIKNPKVKISYTNINTSRIANSEFEIERYIIKDNKSIYKLNAPYKNFTFLNHLTINTNQ